jgi:hypothetical protein
MNEYEAIAQKISSLQARIKELELRPVPVTSTYIFDTDPWVYVAADQFKVVGKDVRSRFTTGTKIRCFNSATKYFTVLSAAFGTDTTVTLTGGSDYALANAAISANYYSYVFPHDFPALFSYSPIWTAATTGPVLGNGTLIGQFHINDRSLRCWGALVIGSTTTLGSGTWSISIPAACIVQPSVQFRSLGNFWINDVNLSANRRVGSVSVVRYQTVMNTFFSGTQSVINATAPFAWEDGDTLQWDVTYPI